MALLVVDWHYFSVVDAENPIPYPVVKPDGEDWFLGSREREIRVFTGIAAGRLNVPVTIHSSPPAVQTDDVWGEVREATLNVASGTMSVKGPDDAGATYEIRPGWVRVRIHRTRDASIWDLAEDFPVGERYMIEAWSTDIPPATADTDSVLEETSMEAGVTVHDPGVRMTSPDQVRERRRQALLRRLGNRNLDR